MYYLNKEDDNRFFNKNYVEKSYHPQMYYDERCARERQTLEFGDVSHRRERDYVLNSERDLTLPRERDFHVVREIEPVPRPILVRERYLEQYHQEYPEYDVSQREPEYFPGPDHRFPEPNVPGPRMPYYQHPQRTALPAAGARSGPPWQPPFHRNHAPRRRHHLDDIFLPNHDDEECPQQEEGFRPRHSRPPPVRTTVVTNARCEAIAKPPSSTSSNLKVLSEKVSVAKSDGRTVIDPKVTDKSNIIKNSKNPKPDEKGSITKTAVKSSDKTFNLQKSFETTINEDKNNTKTHKDDNVSPQCDINTDENMVKTSKVNTKDNVMVSKSSENVKSGSKEYVPKSVLTTNKKHANKIIDNIDKNSSIYNSFETASKKIDLKKTKIDNVNCQDKLPVSEVNTRTRSSSIEKGKVAHQNNQKIDAFQNAPNQKKTEKYVSDSTNIQTDPKVPQFMSRIKKGSDEKHIYDVTGQAHKSNFKPTNDTYASENKISPLKDKPSNDINDRTASLDSKPQVQKIAGKSHVEKKNKEKLINKDCVRTSTPKTKTQQKSTKDRNDKGNEYVQRKKEDKPDNVQVRLKEHVMIKNTVNSHKENSIKVNYSGNHVKNNMVAMNKKDKPDSDSEIDIVKELEMLVNEPDNHAITEKKNVKESVIEQKLMNEPMDEIMLEEGPSTQDPTFIATPTKSNQEFKKDIIIKLIRTPLAEKSLAADKGLRRPITTNCGNDDDVSKKNKHIGKKPNKNDLNNFGKLVNTTIKVSNLGNSADCGRHKPILEEIFILEDALKNIDNEQISQEPSSSPKNNYSTGNLSISKKIIKDDENNTNDLKEVQIVEEKYDVIDLVGDNDDDRSYTKPTISNDVIKIESPDECERYSKSPINVNCDRTLENDRPLEDFGNLDTRGSFLWTFHQKFDDPRVIDMDICDSPSSCDAMTEPAQSEQQKETDRVIKDMDALWNQISGKNNSKCGISGENSKLKNSTGSQKAVENKVTPTSDNTSSIDPLEKDCNTKVIPTSNNSVQDMLPKTATPFDKKVKIASKSFSALPDLAGDSTFSSIGFDNVDRRKTFKNNEAGNLLRRMSFSHKNNNVNDFKVGLRKTKSLNDIVSMIGANSDFFIAPTVKHLVTNLINRICNESCTQTITNIPEANELSKNIILNNSLNEKHVNLKPSSLMDNKDKLLLSSSEYQDKKCLSKDSALPGLGKKLDGMSKTVFNNMIASQDDADKDANLSVKKKKLTVKELKKKRIRRIETSDEESTEERYGKFEKNGKYQPKPKKQKLSSKPTRKRKLPLEDKKKYKEIKKNVEVPSTTLSIEERQAKSSIVNKPTTLPNTTVNTSAPSMLSGPSARYVTKAEYVKYFAKGQSVVPNISLSIEPMPKTQKTVHRRATFTCEADTETIFKKVDSEERYKQKFLDLFGSVSDDEDDLLQVSFEEDPYLKEKNITLDTKSIANRKKSNKTRKRRISKSFIRESDMSDSYDPNSNSETTLFGDYDSTTTSNPSKLSKKLKICSDTANDTCKIVRIPNGPTVQSKQKITTEIRALQRKDKSSNTNLEIEIDSSKEKKQKSIEKFRDTNVDNHHKDSNKRQLGSGDRRKSTSSTENKSRNDSDKGLMPRYGRISRSRSKESDSTNISDVDKHIAKNEINKETKYEKASNAQECKNTQNSEQNARKLQLKRSSSDSRRDSTSSVESNNSAHNNRKKEIVDKKILKENKHQQKLLFEDKITNERDKKETNADGLKQKITDPFWKDRVRSEGTAITQSKKKTVKDSYQEAMKSSSNSCGIKETESSSIKNKNKRNLVKVLQLKTKDISVDTIKKLKETYRRNSAPDILSSSAETSLIIREVEDLPLLYRASEGEVDEEFQICQPHIPQVTKYVKITKLAVVDAECIDKVYVSEPPQIYTDSKTIKEPNKEDDDVIEIRPVIPMIDLTEEDLRINRESSSKENLCDLLLEAKKELQETSKEEAATITLYRSEEDHGNQDEEVQAIAVSIPFGLPERNFQLKKNKDLLQDATIASSTEEVSTLTNTFIDEESTFLDNNKIQEIPDVVKKAHEMASPAASHLFSNLVQDLEIGITSNRHISENSPPGTSNIETSQPPVIQGEQPSLEDENQQAVSSILDIQQSKNARVNTDAMNDLQPNTKQVSKILPSVLETTSQSKNINDNLNVQKVNHLRPVGQNNHFDIHNSQTTNESQKTRSESHVFSQAPPLDNSGKNQLPMVIIRPTRAGQNVNADISSNFSTETPQNQICQKDVSGQHQGLPQTLRDYRPVHRVKATVVPPTLVNINPKPSSSQMNVLTQTAPQNVGTKTIQNTSIENNQNIPENAMASEIQRSVIDLTDDNAELSTMDFKLIVDIFTRHAFFLAHLYKAQNGYIEYLKQQSFCQNYFRAEIALFEEQKQERLISQSLRLVTELQSLNIRATRNLSSSASKIVEQIAVNLANREMPKQVTKSMAYLLIAQLIKPQSERFAKIPLLKILIRVCDVVLTRIFSKSPGVLTEMQRQILTYQVEQYNRLFGNQSLSSNQLNLNLYVGQPNTDQSTNPLISDEHHNKSRNTAVLQNKSLSRSSGTVSRNRDEILGSPVISQTNQSNSGQQMALNSHSSDKGRQPVVSPSNRPPIARLGHQFGSPRHTLSNSSNGTVTKVTKSYRSSPNVGANIAMQTESSPIVHQLSMEPNRMNPPNAPPNVGANIATQTESSPLVHQLSMEPNPMNPPNAKIPIFRQHRFVQPRPPRIYVVPNMSPQIRSVVRPIINMPGGANTNTLGCTPRYLPNFDTPIQTHVYPSLGRPQQQTNTNNIVLNCCPPPPSSNPQGLEGLLTNQNNLNHRTSSVLFHLLDDSNATNQGNVLMQQSPQRTVALQNLRNNVVPQSPRNNVVTPSSRHSVIFQSPGHIVVSQTPLYQSSPSRLPSYEESVASISKHPSNGSSQNQSSFDEAKKRNENLLQELLTSPDNDPLFRSPSPVNNNFRIKLPFTQPDVTPSTTVLSSSVCVESNMSVSCATVSSTISQVSNNTASKLVLSSQPLIQNNLASISPQSNVQDHQGPTLSFPSSTSQAPIVLVNNIAAGKSYVVRQPKQNIELNQGLAALSSIGPASAMLNSSSHHAPINQPTNDESPIMSIIYKSSPQGTSHLVNSISTTHSSSMSHPQKKISANKDAVIHPRPSPAVGPTRQGNVTASCPSVKLKFTSIQTPNKAKSKKPKPEVGSKKPKSKSRSKPKKKCGPANKKKVRLSKTIEVVDLLSSDEDMTSENQSVKNKQTAVEEKSNIIKRSKAQVKMSNSTAKSTKNRTDNKSAAGQQQCTSQGSFEDELSSTLNTQTEDRELSTPAQTQSSRVLSLNTQTQNKDLRTTTNASSTALNSIQHRELPTPTQNQSNCLISPNTQTGIEDLQPSTSNRLAGTNGEDEVETIDLTWIDEIDDQELQREMDFVFIKTEEPADENEVAQERNNMAMPSPADSGISSPSAQGEDDTIVYTVNVQRLCICSNTAQYNCVCGDAWYCGQDCQINDWASHQKVCQIAQETTDHEEELVVNEQEENISDET